MKVLRIRKETREMMYLYFNLKEKEKEKKNKEKTALP